MWPKTFELRMLEWHALRENSKSVELAQALTDINQWWMHSPWRPYYLHWDDRRTWPTPWELLADNVFCDLARALGIMYTILLLDRSDIKSVEIIQTDQGNLVQVNKGKYILNWSPTSLLNIVSEKLTIEKVLSSTEFEHLVR